MVDKKNIWIIHYQEPPIQAAVGSNERLWRSNALAEEMARQGHNAFRWRSSFNHYKKLQMCQGPHIENINGVKQVYIPTTGYKGHFSFRRIISHYFLGQGFNRVINHFKLEEPDIIHVCNVPPELLIQVSKYARRKNIPLIVDVRDLWPEAYANRIPSRFKLARQVMQSIFVFLSFRYRAIISEADALTTISVGLMDYLLAKYGRRRSEYDRVFHMGAMHTVSSLVETNAEGSEKVGATIFDSAKRDPLSLIYAGNIGFQTNFDRIISLKRALDKKDIDVEVKICGDGPRLEELRAKTLGMKGIIFTGWLDGKEFREQLDNADFGLIFFFPNLDFELSIPSKVSEYLSSTKGLLSISDGSVRALIAEHQVGLDCYGLTDDEIVELLAEYASNPILLDNFAKNARRLYQEKFSQQKITKKMAAHTLTVLKEKKQNSPRDPLFQKA